MGVGKAAPGACPKAVLHGHTLQQSSSYEIWRAVPTTLRLLNFFCRNQENRCISVGMERLIDALESTADFFVEHVQITAIVFDNTNDVTVWATTHLDSTLYFFHLGLQFQQLDLLVRLTAERAEALQEEIAEALATVTEWPCLLEYHSQDRPPVALPGVALKLACTYPADGPPDEADAGIEFIELRGSTTPDDANFDDEDDLEDDSADEDDYDEDAPHNIFYLEGIFLRIEP